MQDRQTKQAIQTDRSQGSLSVKGIRNIIKTIIVLVVTIGAIWSAVSFVNTLNARTIMASSDEIFWDIGQNIDVETASIEELKAIAARALTVQPRHLVLAEKANDLLLSKLDTCLDCETRTVVLDEFRTASLSKTGLIALARTYELSPYGSIELMKWRLETSNRHWTSLDSDLQKAALSQITAIGQQSEGRDWLLGLVTNNNEIAERIERFQTPETIN